MKKSNELKNQKRIEAKEKSLQRKKERQTKRLKNKMF